jgi:hypothetical protein
MTALLLSKDALRTLCNQKRSKRHAKEETADFTYTLWLSSQNAAGIFCRDDWSYSAKSAEFAGCP